MPKEYELIDEWLKALEQPSKPLTKWELDFLANVRDQFDRTLRLTRAQKDTLEKIYAEKTP